MKSRNREINFTHYMCVCLYTFLKFVSRLFLNGLKSLFFDLKIGDKFKSRNLSISRHFATFATFIIMGDMMVNFRKYLQQSKDMKFDAISRKKESEPNPYSCNYSPVSHHKYCEHKHCIFDEDWIREDVAKTRIRNLLREEESYLKNGEGTVGYDRVSVYKNVLKLKNKLEKLDSVGE